MKAGAFMDAIEAIIGRRSIRKFQQKAVPVKIIQKLMDAARFYPSPANLQPLKFRIVSEQEDRARLAAQLHWAAYLPEFTHPMNCLRRIWSSLAIIQSAMSLVFVLEQLRSF